VTRYPDIDPEIGITSEDIRHALLSLDGLRTAINASDPINSLTHRGL
jgi:hypothetical protein